MDRFMLQRANANSNKIFKAKDNRPQLTLSIVDRNEDEAGQCALEAGPKVPINQITELDAAITTRAGECGRIYTVHHMRSWSTLDISRELFDRFLRRHEVFPNVWRTVHTFGLKSFENEYRFPILQAKESWLRPLHIQELTYVMRRVEWNGRSLPECPWSIRQTGVYHKLADFENMPRESASIFLLLAPSSALESDVSQAISRTTWDSGGPANWPFSIHKCVVAESLLGWMDYLCWLEEQLRIKSTRIIATPIDGNRESGAIKSVEADRQDLKQLEDYITDLLVIIQTQAQTIKRLKKGCRRYCEIWCWARGTKRACTCHIVIGEFGEFAIEAESYHERARVLQTRVQSIQNLLSDLLGYEEVRTLRELAKASHQESADIKQLTMRSARDAAAVKVLTIIGLVFLPTTMVENFFSTQFIKTDGEGLQISEFVWVMVAVAVPLTVFVVVLWRLCLWYERCRLQPSNLSWEYRNRLGLLEPRIDEKGGA
ncbi:uncharacterized protein BJX67DRAFT_280794 [Aspergillus lucknowensis]|uniref:CorA-like transporter domain-containing protein n=1 Tax=Aspergillus lucknowensis TaxID=176173 RepID=A0ABR4M0L3_9EURO